MALPVSESLLFEIDPYLLKIVPVACPHHDVICDFEIFAFWYLGDSPWQPPFFLWCTKTHSRRFPFPCSTERSSLHCSTVQSLCSKAKRMSSLVFFFFRAFHESSQLYHCSWGSGGRWPVKCRDEHWPLIGRTPFWHRTFGKIRRT